MNPLTTASSHDERDRDANVAVLPVGSFEQHGGHLPLATDTYIASAVGQRIAEAYNLFLLPPITLSCSHEHAAFAGSVSLSARTLFDVVRDVAASLESSGVRRLVLVNGHGGNYVLSNIVQESNTSARRMLLFPGREDWAQARQDAGCKTDAHDDMHAGELETSILLNTAPELVRESYSTADATADERPHLLTVGVASYSPSGVIGVPSAASADKGAAILRTLVHRFRFSLEVLLEASS